MGLDMQLRYAAPMVLLLAGTCLVLPSLAQVFRKTHTSQQSQLVSLLLGILPVGR